MEASVGLQSLSLVPDHWAMPPFSPTRKHNGELENILVHHRLAYTTDLGGGGWRGRGTGFLLDFLWFFFFNIAHTNTFFSLVTEIWIVKCYNSAHFDILLE